MNFWNIYTLSCKPSQQTSDFDSAKTGKKFHLLETRRPKGSDVKSREVSLIETKFLTQQPEHVWCV